MLPSHMSHDRPWRGNATYSLYTKCMNCGAKGRTTITRGRPLGDQPCENCGCKTLAKHGVL